MKKSEIWKESSNCDMETWSEQTVGTMVQIDSWDTELPHSICKKHRSCKEQWSTIKQAMPVTYSIKKMETLHIFLRFPKMYYFRSEKALGLNEN